MVGIEFVVAEAHAPDLFVIHKRYRDGPSRTRLLAVFYCMNDAILCVASCAPV
jgi:hypothetical protein